MTKTISKVPVAQTLALVAKLKERLKACDEGREEIKVINERLRKIDREVEDIDDQFKFSEHEMYWINIPGLQSREGSAFTDETAARTMAKYLKAELNASDRKELHDIVVTVERTPTSEFMTSGVTYLNCYFDTTVEELYRDIYASY